MAKIIRENLAPVSEDVIRSIMRKDAPSVSTKTNEYLEANLLGYYVVVNTWLLLVKEWSNYGWVYLLNHLKEKGLLPVIREFSDSADQIVHGELPESKLVSMIQRDVASKGVILGVPTMANRSFHYDPMSALLLICRYPKRFSPSKADLLQDSTLRGFVYTQRVLKRNMRTEYSTFVTSRVRDTISRMLDWDRLCNELDAVNIDDIEFTSGTTFDTDASLCSKLSRIAKDHVEYFPQVCGIPLVAHQLVPEWEPEQRWGRDEQYEKHPVRIIAVPKNFKTARTIAPEDVYRQATARRYFRIADRYLPTVINLHDQTQNQQLALAGSLSGEIATIDLSQASDSITRPHLVDMFPSRFVQIMDRVLPTHFIYKGKTQLMHSAATMGNSMTFWLESVLFYGITRAASDFAASYAPNNGVVSVYGDDIICSTDAAPTVMDWLGILGFSVNETKSFADPNHRYRESCGEEYYNGINVSSAYFPRHTLEGTLGGKMSTRNRVDAYTGVRVDTMTSLVELQHKLFEICVPASLLITEIVHEALPSMTTSTPDMGLSDLWSYQDSPIVRSAPAQWPRGDDGKGIINHDFDREKHSTPVTKFKIDGKLKDRERLELLYNLYKYQQFLKYGPRYDSELDRLLGVTSKPLSFEEAAGRPEIIWVPIG